MEEEIVGKWQWDTVSYEFHREGTYNYVNTYSGIRTNGRYTISGDTITFFVNGTARSARFSLNGSRFTLYHHGTSCIYTRV